MKIKVIGNKVLIRPSKEEEVSKGGILLPQKSQERPSCGIVLNVGPGKWDDGKLIPMQIEVGDVVHYSRTFGQPVKLNGEELLVVKEEDVLLAVEE